MLLKQLKPANITRNQSAATEKLQPQKLPPQQSDIVIDPQGKVHVSFLWDDLRDLPTGIQEPAGQVPFNPGGAINWTMPEIHESTDFVSEYRQCRLCPKECGFNRVERAHRTCGDYQLRVATAGITFGDEPEIRGSRGSGAVMLSGCPLTCPSCHNPEKVADGVVTSIEGLIEICRELLVKGAHNIQLLSPTVHLPSLRVALRHLKANAFPIPIILKSSGYESVEQLKLMAGLVDIYLPDLKFGSCSVWARRAGVGDYFEKTVLAINEMLQQVGPAQLNSDGVLQRGVLVRRVESPLPGDEKQQVHSFLNGLPDTVLISAYNNFVLLE